MSDTAEGSAGTAPTRAEVCVVACAEAWRGDGEMLASPMGGTIPLLAARLARLTFAPDLLLTDGEAYLMGDVPPLGCAAAGDRGLAAVPRSSVAGRHRAAAHIHGRQPAGPVREPEHLGHRRLGQPQAQLLGMRGAPGNTVNHPTSYWVPRHSRRVFVERVDIVCGLGYDRAEAAGPAASRFHEIRRVVTNLAVLDFATRGSLDAAGVAAPGGERGRRHRRDRLRAHDPGRLPADPPATARTNSA